MKNCTQLWLEANFEAKTYKTHHSRSTFGSCDVEKSARRCGAKHTSKSTCTKHSSFGALLEVEMTKKRTPLWPRFQGKIYKTHHSRSTFGSQDVEKVHSVVARSTFGSEKCKKVTVSDQFLEVRMRFFCVACARDSAPYQR